MEGKKTKVELTEVQVHNLNLIQEIEDWKHNFKELGSLIDKLFYQHVIDHNDELFFNSEEVSEIKMISDFFKDLKLKHE